MRKSGIKIIGDIPWGTHFSQFYETKKDLIDILVPYFKAGLENNEFCMWVTSDPLEVKEAKTALRKAVKNLEKHIKKGQIEVIDASQWYIKKGKFEADRVLKGWIEKENGALKKGFDGVRLSGNTFWLESGDWKDFIDYEEKVQSVIGSHRMIAVCTYSLQKCGPLETIDMASCHQFVLIKKKGQWTRVENTEHKKKEEQLKESERRYRELWDCAPVAYHILDKKGIILRVNQTEEKMLGYSKEEMVGRSIFDFILPAQRSEARKRFLKKISGYRLPRKNKRIYVRKDGSQIYVVIDDVLERDREGKVIGVWTIMVDVTENKKAEISLRSERDKLQALMDGLARTEIGIDIVGIDYKVLFQNQTLRERFGDLTGKTCYENYMGLNEPCNFCPMIKAIKSNKVETFELTGADGKNYKLFSAPIPNPDGTVDSAIEVVQDITERKKSEAALRESEERYRDLVEKAGIAILIDDKKGHFKYFNKQFAELFGYSVQEMKKKSIYSLVHPEDAKKVKEFHEGRIKGERVPSRYEFRGISKDGSIKHIELDAVELIEADNIIGTRSYLRDITERKMTEEALSESEELFRSIVENSHAGILIVNGSYRVVYVNDELCRITGYSREEVIGQDFRKFLDEESRQLVTDRYVRRQRGEKVPSRYEFNIIQKSGEKRRVEISSTVIKDSSGKVQTVAQILDITKRQKSEERLRIEKARLDQLFESAQEGLVMADKQGRVIRVNNEFVRLFGYTAEEALGRHVDELVLPKGEIDKGVSITKNVAGGESFAFEATRQRKDGTPIDVSVLASPIILDDEVVAVYAIYRDITARKRTEEAIRVRKSQLELVHRIQNDIPMNMDIETILKSAAESIGKSFGYNKVSVNLFDEDRQELMYIIGWNMSGTPTPRGHRQRIGEGLIGKAAQLRKTIIANDVSKEPSYVVYYQTETKSELTIPLVVQDHLVGVLDIQDIKKDAFKKDDVSVLQSIANYIAYVIDEKQTEEALRVSEAKYRNLVELSPDAILFLDMKGVIISSNTYMTRGTGYSKEEIVGKNFRELEFLPNEDIPKYIKLLNKAAKGKVPKPFEVIWHHKDGTSYLAEVRVGFIKEDGKNVGLQVVARDFTERKKAEELIKTSLREKEVLLREIHHRVKNNMQIISSLLRLQSRQIKNKEILDMFNVGQNRIRSMALIHESLYQSKDLARISFSDYIKRLTTHLFSIYRTEMESINLKIDVRDVFLDINRAIPCGLIINELVFNSLKHAFPDGKKGEIAVEMNKNKRDKYTLIVSDTGIGFPEKVDFQNTETLGMQLVTDLVRQLNGTIELARESGTEFKIVF